MIAQGLSDDEVADVMNYIMNSWDNEQKEMVTLTKVQNIKEP
jgi:mono/diheme cytochrome c family protein